MLNFFKKNKKPENLKEVLGHLDALKEQVKSISDELEKLKKESKFCIQKIEIIRYNPFSGAGGNQSFTVILLDGNNNGIIITSLYAQDGNRVYAKPIKNGISEYPLSREEKETIEKAKSSK